MPSPCNNLNVVPIKVSQLVRYKNIDIDDFFLTVESGSALYSRKSTFGDLLKSIGNYTGSYSGSFKGTSSGSFSGSYWGKILSKNTVASGSFSGSYRGKILSKNTVASGSFSGSYYGSVLSKNTKVTGSFRGSVVSTNTIASGSFSGSYGGKILSKNTVASGSFSGSHYGKIFSKNTVASGSFSGSHYGKVIGSKGSLMTGSFRGIDNITNFNGTGKKVSFNGTASYAISASYVGGPARLFSTFNNATDSTNFATYTWSLSVTKPSNATWSEFDCFIDHLGRTDDGLTLTGNILFDSDGTNVSSQYSNNTGCGNSGMTWAGTVDNDSCLIHWHHQGMVRTADISSNTFTLRFIINKSGGSYDLATPTTYYGIKAKYYIP